MLKTSALASVVSVQDLMLTAQLGRRPTSTTPARSAPPRSTTSCSPRCSPSGYARWSGGWT
ncbi:hypothetical protein NKH77_49750 [Streptomyces sp. M19]